VFAHSVAVGAVAVVTSAAGTSVAVRSFFCVPDAPSECDAEKKFWPSYARPDVLVSPSMMSVVSSCSGCFAAFAAISARTSGSGCPALTVRRRSSTSKRSAGLVLHVGDRHRVPAERLVQPVAAPLAQRRGGAEPAVGLGFLVGVDARREQPAHEPSMLSAYALRKLPMTSRESKTESCPIGVFLVFGLRNTVRVGVTAENLRGRRCGAAFRVLLRP
jgi:hypothetical protein